MGILNSDYTVELIGSEKNILKLREAFNNLEYYRDKYKKEFNYFLGLRKNWFPLVLLNLVEQGNDDAVSLFNLLLRNNDCHRLYYKVIGMTEKDGFSMRCQGKEWVIRISIYERNIDYCRSVVSTIVNMFGLKCYVVET